MRGGTRSMVLEWAVAVGLALSIVTFATRAAAQPPEDAADAGAPPVAPAAEAESGVVRLEEDDLISGVADDDLSVPLAGGAEVGEAGPASAYRAMQGISITRKGLNFGLNFFGDVGYFAGDNIDDTTVGVRTFSNNFAVLHGVLLATATLDEHYLALFEVNAETGLAGPVVDVERLFVGWRDGPHYVRLGRTHTDLGFWNNAYHHGVYVQPTVERPRAIRWEDEGGLIPNHSVGLFGHAEVALSATVDLGLGAGVFNGRGNIVDDVRVVDDTNNEKALHLRFDLGLLEDSLHIGVAGFLDWIAPAGVTERAALPDAQIVELITSAHVAYRGSTLTLLVEGHAIDHIYSASGRTIHDISWSTYAVAQYRIGVVSPYLGIDVLSIDRTDPFYFPAVDTTGVQSIDRVTSVIDGIVGLRIETGDWAALKLEYRLTHDWFAGEIHHLAAANWGWGI